MDLGLSGKTAIVTGASKGIGLAVASVLAAEGARVALVARDPDALERAAQQVDGAIAIAADTRDADAIAAAVASTERDLGPVDILVTAAATPNTAGGFSESDLPDQIDTKMGGALRCARAVAPGMVDRGWGRIVCISGLAARSTGSIVGSVRNVAVAAMVKNLADELGPRGVNVSCVHPGMTITERSPDTFGHLAEQRGVSPEEVERGFADGVSVGRLITAEEVADVVAFLCSPRSVAICGDAIAAGGGAKGSIYY